MPITIEVAREPDIDAWSAAIQRGTENAMPAIGEVLVEAAVSCFDNERDPWGEEWASLREATVRERERAGKAGKIGTRDGILKGSIARTPTSSTPGVTSTVVAPGGAAAAYAAKFQFGDEHQFGRAYLPIRHSGEVELPPALETEIVETLRESILAEIQRTGPGR